MSTPKKWTMGLLLLGSLLITLLSAGLLALAWKTPSNDLDWQTQFQQLPSVSIEADNIHIQHLRDFRYTANDKIHAANYRQGHYQFTQLKQLWYGISHFGPMGLAHVFVSFEFNDGQFLVVSVEARLRTIDESYHPLHGLFRQYQKTIVLATEQDVIGLRSHIRKEKLYLYPLQLSIEQQQQLLRNYLNMAQSLQHTPTFYNTLSDNCMTGLLIATTTFNHWWQWLDYRVIFPGYSDRLAYQKALLTQQPSLAAAQTHYRVDGNIGSVDDPHFSRVIRQQKGH